MLHKKWTDIVAMVMFTAAIITGFMLHREVHHIFVYDNTGLWAAHIVIGLIGFIALIFHCMQHKLWFNNYAKLPVVRKGLTSILLVLAILVAISGIILAMGSHSHFVSIFHYITAIVFTVAAIVHVAKRWRIFKALFK